MKEYLKVVPYIETLCSNNFKTFLEQPFKIDMLYPITNETPSETFFSGWRGKNMVNWYKFVNDDKITLEFYESYYYIKSDQKFPFPKTINDFINTMCVFDIALYWSDYIYEKFEPKEYMGKDIIKNYYIELLNKMEKGFELNL
jgi:hypothetical protein